MVSTFPLDRLFSILTINNNNIKIKNIDQAI
ncbi:hypothetical protein TREPR_3019 [Treponema primitia ZAS-2]|uniref:Uncharacterized protein n=1 Tax=Treponema primitia (strain ATCC BAA-887 / DSM 12427 / ZAS-2) TaxID=545694 RepID=F5YNG4_TREPZ|nr:hypothetical protein TREPR_3019 [Treponema primitia ZAS-2]